MTAFSQLVSRMGHPYEPSFQLLKKIIVKMIISFPQQACWTFIFSLRVIILEYLNNNFSSISNYDLYIICGDYFLD